MRGRGYLSPQPGLSGNTRPAAAEESYRIHALCPERCVRAGLYLAELRFSWLVGYEFLSEPDALRFCSPVSSNSHPVTLVHDCLCRSGAARRDGSTSPCRTIQGLAADCSSRFYVRGSRNRAFVLFSVNKHIVVCYVFSYVHSYS